MELLQTFGIALGLASLAGLNLYLTVFVTGLAIQQQWVDVAQTNPDLLILAHPVILALSGALYLVGFLADKIPWVDSLWDALHTLIRPIGGAFLAMRVLDTPAHEPVYEALSALLGGSAGLLMHGLKAGTRLVVNHSPEPFSNIALSLIEDLAVLAGLALIRHNPLWALAVFSTLLLGILYFTPKLLRAIKVQLWLIRKKIGAPAGNRPAVQLVTDLPADLHILFHDYNLLGEKIQWAVPCVSGKGPGLPRNVFGSLVATEGDPTKIWFIARNRLCKLAREIDLSAYKITREPKFISENLVCYSLEKKPKYLFLFNRSQDALVDAVVDSLRQRLASIPPKETPLETPQPAPEAPISAEAKSEPAPDAGT